MHEIDLLKYMIRDSRCAAKCRTREHYRGYRGRSLLDLLERTANMTNEQKSVSKAIANVTSTVKQIIRQATGSGSVGGGGADPNILKKVLKFVHFYTCKNRGAWKPPMARPWPVVGVSTPLMKSAARGLLLAASIFQDAANKIWKGSAYHELFEFAARRISAVGASLIDAEIDFDHLESPVSKRLKPR